jgi:hypothetical protein
VANLPGLTPSTGSLVFTIPYRDITAGDPIAAFMCIVAFDPESGRIRLPTNFELAECTFANWLYGERIASRRSAAPRCD